MQPKPKFKSSTLQYICKYRGTSCTRAWDAQQIGRDQASLGLELQSVNVSARWGLLVNAMPQSLHSRAIYGTHSIGGWVGPRAALDGAEILPPPGFVPQNV